MSKRYDFKWRKAQAPSAGRKEETVPAPLPASRVATAPVTRAAAPVPAQVAETALPSHERIADRAYGIWEKQGRPPGTDRDDWFEAERQLDAEDG